MNNIQPTSSSVRLKTLTIMIKGANKMSPDFMSVCIHSRKSFIFSCLAVVNGLRKCFIGVWFSFLELFVIVLCLLMEAILKTNIRLSQSHNIQEILADLCIRTNRIADE